jgi:hypothetical protein
MTTAIDLDHQSMLMAREVCKISADRCLSPEVSTFHGQSPQVPPQLSLGVRHRSTQRSCPPHPVIRLA